MQKTIKVYKILNDIFYYMTIFSILLLIGVLAYIVSLKSIFLLILLAGLIWVLIIDFEYFIKLTKERRQNKVLQKALIIMPRFVTLNLAILILVLGTIFIVSASEKDITFLLIVIILVNIFLITLHIYYLMIHKKVKALDNGFD